MEQIKLPRNRIRELAKPLGGLKKVAEQANFNFGTLSQVVNLKRNATIGTMQQIADTLGIPFWQLFISQEEAAAWKPEQNAADELPFDNEEESAVGLAAETSSVAPDLITIDPNTGEAHRYRRID